ncbi:unnamed protein product, partial [Discosporangium mesarthrocarpum]
MQVRYVRHDPGGEWQGPRFRALLEEMGAVSEQTNTNRLDQNGVAERRIAVLDTGARASLYSASLGDKLWLWGEAYKHAAYVLNSTATEANQGASPYTRLSGTVGTLNGFEPFGTPGYKSDPQKLTWSSRPALHFVGGDRLLTTWHLQSTRPDYSQD